MEVEGPRLWWRRAAVEAVENSRPGLQMLRVRILPDDDAPLPASLPPTSGARGLPGGAAPSDTGDPTDPVGAAGDPTGPGASVRAVNYPQVCGAARVGDRVLVTVGALRAGLGTGGHATVVAIPDRLPPDPPAAPGHLVKARYTPLQPIVLGVDEQHSAHHEVLREADDLAGMPVVAADLHSALPAIVAAAHHRAGRRLRIAYVMTDGGALPAAYSRTVAALRASGLLECCITVGQAYGGDLEAVSVHSALLAARLVAGAEIAVVAQGPGNLGTGTRWGFSGVSAGEALNAAGILGGRPVASLRVSGADARARHRGLSHHSLTAYGRVALVPVDVVVPEFGEDLAEVQESLDAAVGVLGAPTGRHRLVRVDTTGLAEVLARCPVPLSTMGRTLAEDPASFLAAGASGLHAADLVDP